MGVYTKKGDKGDTSTLDKSKGRMSKDSLTVESLGSIDELNSFLGVARSFCDNPERDVFIADIQDKLFTIASILAGSKLKINKSRITRFEKEIDAIEEKIGAIDSFRYSQGTRFATHLMYARALARRTERRVVALSHEQTLHPNILQYLNRLSDMLFMLFREANFDAQVSEESWSPKGLTVRDE